MEKKFKYVKIFGERNTGTNALKILIEENSRSRVLPSVYKDLNLLTYVTSPLVQKLPFKYKEMFIDMAFYNKKHRFLWKHSATIPDKSLFEKEILYIFCVRHPVSWCLSLFKNNYHINKKYDNFLTFLESNIDLHKRDNLPEKSLNPILLWELKVQSYLNLSNELNKNNYHFIKFENLIKSQNNIFSSLSMQLLSPNQNIQIIEKSTKNPSKDYKYYQDYYNNEIWRNEVNSLELDFIEQSISNELTKFFGYKINN